MGKPATYAEKTDDNGSTYLPPCCHQVQFNGLLLGAHSERIPLHTYIEHVMHAFVSQIACLQHPLLRCSTHHDTRPRSEEWQCHRDRGEGC